MLTEDQLFKRMKLNELKSFVEAVRLNAHNDRTEMTRMRLKQGLYKKFRDELIPFVEYSELMYPDNDEYTFQLINGNQNYDCEVTTITSLVERIELTFPQDGHQNSLEARQLVSNGITEVRLIDEDTQKNLIDIIIRTAIRKSLNDYSEKTLVIFIDETFDFDLSDSDDMIKIDELVSNLKKISHSASKVFFMIMKQMTNKELFPSKIYKIK